MELANVDSLSIRPAVAGTRIIVRCVSFAVLGSPLRHENWPSRVQQTTIDDCYTTGGRTAVFLAVAQASLPPDHRIIHQISDRGGT